MNSTYFKKLVNPSNKEITVIAEMSGNHQNSYNAALKFINSCIKQNVDIVKFQVYKPDTMTIKSESSDFLIKKSSQWKKFKSLYDLFQHAHTPWTWIEKFTKILNKKNIHWFASAFDSSSIDFLESIHCQAYKLASPEITDIGLIEKIANTGKPLIISTGMASLEDIKLAVKTIKKKHNKFAILKCTSSYPADSKDLNLKAINLLRKYFKCAVGYSDHTIGEHAALTAVGLGATIIEKHFKLDGDNLSVDASFSMELSKFKLFKDNLDNVKISLGKETLNNKLSKLKNSGRRSLYVCQDINLGEKFTLENIRSIRPSYGMHPKYLKKILGKKAKKNIKTGNRLTKDLIQKFKHND
jgi:pseudaminic acid synthase